MVVPLLVNHDYLTTIDLGSSRCFFCHGQKRDYLSRVSQWREARLKIQQKWWCKQDMSHNLQELSSTTFNTIIPVFSCRPYCRATCIFLSQTVWRLWCRCCCSIGRITAPHIHYFHHSVLYRCTLVLWQTCDYCAQSDTQSAESTQFSTHTLLTAGWLALSTQFRSLYLLGCNFIVQIYTSI